MSGARGVLAVARLELEQNAFRPLSIVLGGFFLLIVAGTAYAAAQGLERFLPNGQPLPPEFQTGLLLAAMAGATAFLGPIVPIVSSALSIVEERSTRSIDLLLSRPVTRRGLAAGKVLGRALHVGVLALAGIAIGLGLAAPKVALSLPEALAFTLLVVLLCTAWVSLAVLLSSAVRTPTIALVGAFGFYFLFLVLGVALGWVGLGGLAPLLNPNTLFLGAFAHIVAIPQSGQAGFDALTHGLDQAIALPALVLYAIVAALLAVEVFHRQDEAGG